MPAGITLMELLLVMGLMAMALMLAVPAFQSMVQSTLDKEVNHMSGVIRMLRNEAVLGHKRFRILLDLEKGGFTVEERDQYGDYVERTEPQVLRPREFPPEFQLREAVVFGKTFRPDDKVPAPVYVDPSGYIDPFLIHFDIEEAAYTLKVTGFTGRVELLNGHVDPEVR